MVDHIKAMFPRLADGSFRVSSDRDQGYNCIAWAAGVTHQRWWPLSWIATGVGTHLRIRNCQIRNPLRRPLEFDCHENTQRRAPGRPATKAGPYNPPPYK
jgi:hypothetical protein